MKFFNFIAFCILFLSVKPINQITIFGSSPFGEALKKSPHFLRRTWVQRYDLFLYPPNFLELFFAIELHFSFLGHFLLNCGCKGSDFFETCKHFPKKICTFFESFLQRTNNQHSMHKRKLHHFHHPFSWGLRLIYIIYRYNRKMSKKVDFGKN